jgi:RNA polymerase sigma-70 factor (ECF subfamily)
MADEAELVERAKQGDREAFGQLAEACRPWLYGLCYRLLGDGGAAEDLVQESFLRAFRDLGQLRSPERFRGWLTRIAVNACRMELRRLLARREQLLHVEQFDAPGPESGDSAFAVEEALAQLDRGSRRMIQLFYGDELSQAEIADLLALSTAAVKSRLHRAREKLRKEMLAMMSDQEKARLGVAEKAPWALRTILVVEPEELLRQSLCDALSAAGYEVVVLPTGEAALAAVRERRGQMLLLDKHCVEPHWVEVLTLIQVDAWGRENVPVGVFVDGGSEHQRDVLLAWQAGAFLCLTRPPAVEEVVRFVKQVEEKWREELRPSRRPGGARETA